MFFQIGSNGDIEESVEVVKANWISKHEVSCQLPATPVVTAISFVLSEYGCFNYSQNNFLTAYHKHLDMQTVYQIMHKNE